MITVRKIEEVGGVYRTLVTALRKGCKHRRMYLVKSHSKTELGVAVMGLVAKLEQQGIKRKD